MTKKPSVILTCEHGGNKIPKEVRALFLKERQLLASHRGWDEFALTIARGLHKKLRCPLFYSETSRLVVDNNRSPSNPKVFSKFTRSLSPEIRFALLKNYHAPLRTATMRSISQHLPVHHYSIHSFVPVLFGVTRKNDIGILFDAKRPAELRLAKTLRRHLRAEFPTAKIYFNLPYRGGSDGHATHLRSVFKKSEYLGIEIEFNQAWTAKTLRNRALQQSIAKFAAAIAATTSDLT